MKCSKCGSEQGVFKSGVAKSTGKPWKGWRCGECNEMTWIRDNNGQKPAQPAASSEILQEMKRQTQLLAQILSALRKEAGDSYEPEPEELKADENSPF
jgi:hypothetical protein